VAADGDCGEEAAEAAGAEDTAAEKEADEAARGRVKDGLGVVRVELLGGFRALDEDEPRTGRGATRSC